MFNIYLAQSFEKLVYSAAADDGNVSLCLSLQLRARQASITELSNIISVSFQLANEVLMITKTQLRKKVLFTKLSSNYGCFTAQHQIAS